MTLASAARSAGRRLIEWAVFSFCLLVIYRGVSGFMRNVVPLLLYISVWTYSISDPKPKREDIVITADLGIIVTSFILIRSSTWTAMIGVTALMLGVGVVQ